MYYQLDCEHGADPMVPHYARCFKPIIEPLLTRAEWEATMDINDREPIEWCHINGLPGYACPDHEMHVRRDAENDAGRRGLVYVIGVTTFDAAVGEIDNTISDLCPVDPKCTKDTHDACLKTVTSRKLGEDKT